MAKFPMEIKKNIQPSTYWFNSKSNIKVIMIEYPSPSSMETCVEMMKATWSDVPFDVSSLSNEEYRQCCIKILKMKVLPNSLESLNFIFRVDGLTLIEITHLLRHRMLKSIHAQCSADRFLQEDSCFIPSSIDNSRFKQKYKSLTHECKKLYTEMIDSDEISLLDARYILTRNHRYFYYFSIDLKTAIQFINQRKCTQIQPEMDNMLAHQMHDCISSVIPYFKDAVSLECDNRCVYVNADPEDSSRVYYPDKVHKELIEKKYSIPDGGERLSPGYYLSKKRSEMGVHFNPQDN